VGWHAPAGWHLGLGPGALPEPDSEVQDPGEQGRAEVAVADQAHASQAGAGRPGRHDLELPIGHQRVPADDQFAGAAYSWLFI
jgi:hypothetical protein